jgi:hypothetical protein
MNFIITWNPATGLQVMKVDATPLRDDADPLSDAAAADPQRRHLRLVR